MMEERLNKFNKEFFGPSMEFFKMKFDSVDGDDLIFSCEFNQMCGNPMGFVQGGMISAALDDATSAAMISGYEEKKVPLTTDLHILFHRPLQIGKATMKVRLIKLGQRSATSEGRIYNLEGKLVATLMHTAQPVDKPS
ncbi:PaaI family thioesterase [Gammaproteobacteria bacterium]|nr:PaaI family thioesterase [Gammaproteobacteria bacterium]